MILGPERGPERGYESRLVGDVDTQAVPATSAIISAIKLPTPRRPLPNWRPGRSLRPPRLVRLVEVGPLANQSSQDPVLGLEILDLLVEVAVGAAGEEKE
jgi:hypothetical protein